jgi:hypothetical protein
MRKIKFHSTKPHIDILKPFPASRIVPEWFRKMKPVSDTLIVSVKRCVPFLDSLTAGYVVALPVDVTYSKEQGFWTNAAFEVVSSHDSSQTKDVVLPDEFKSQPFKWINNFHIKTPRGYSCLFVHPMNREDLPFHSFSGIVDTDRHPVVVNFPFVIREDFEGVIPAGTPLIQIIPFKRDDWELEVDDNGKPHHYPMQHEAFNSPLGWYRQKFWKKKKYQ